MWHSVQDVTGVGGHGDGGTSGGKGTKWQILRNMGSSFWFSQLPVLLSFAG